MNGGTSGGTTGSCTCTSCDTGYFGRNCVNIQWNAGDMTELSNAVDNMANGDSAVLAGGVVFKGSSSSFSSSSMLSFYNSPYGIIQCTTDLADCILDGELSRRLVVVQNPPAFDTLTLRALTLKDGYTQDDGGGAYIYEGALVDIILCVFSNCRAAGRGGEGGAICVTHSETIVNIYGTRFTGNSVEVGGNGHDIYQTQDSTITIHASCPPPYSSNTPIRGEALRTAKYSGTINGPQFSFACLSVYSCPAGSHNPSMGSSSSDCATCSVGQYSGSSSISCSTCAGGQFLTESETDDASSACQNCEEGKNSPRGYSECPDWCPIESTCVDDMNGVYNLVSLNGNANMNNGDTAALASGTYRCSEGTCQSSSEMLKLPSSFYGTIKCASDIADCALDGEINDRRILIVTSTGYIYPLTLRALTFKNGYRTNGSGVYISGSSTVEIVLCVFSRCIGGAIYVSNTPTVNVYGSRFEGNDDDIGNYGSLTIYDTCPSPYTSTTPTQGSALDTSSGTTPISGSANNYYCYEVCRRGSYNPTLGASDSCESCPAGKTNAVEGSTSCLIAIRNAADQDELFNAIDKTGNNIIRNGDKVNIAEDSFTCNPVGSNCYSSTYMFFLKNLFGWIECANDNADCVLDGESTRTVMFVDGTWMQALTLRALTFKHGTRAAYFRSGAKVDIALCIFSGSSTGAIYITDSSTNINVYASRFIDNAGSSGSLEDINRISGTITIHDACPYPYDANTPTRGKVKISRNHLKHALANQHLAPSTQVLHFTLLGRSKDRHFRIPSVRLLHAVLDFITRALEAILVLVFFALQASTQEAEYLLVKRVLLVGTL